MGRHTSYPLNWSNLMFDLFMRHPSGVTIHDIANEVDVNLGVARRLVHKFRLEYGSEDINLVAEPSSYLDPWLYRLVGTLDAAEPWVKNRLDDAATRIDTMAVVLGSIVRATPGNTRNGRRARIMERAMRRAQEDLADLNSG
jgi:hypothetical protein